MREIERYSFAHGLSSREVMGTAGKAAAQVLLERTNAGDRILVVCGCGNNGGDGFVCGEALAQEGRKVEILLIGDHCKLSADAAYYLKKAEASLADKSRGQYAWVVDALFGIGFHGQAQGEAAEAIRLIHNMRLQGSRVLSIDIPSGLDPENGQVAGDAVEADVTVTFQFAKTGQYLGKGLNLCGELILAPVGLFNPFENLILNPTLHDVASLFPERQKVTHKGTYGHVGILAGSMGMEGAGALAAVAALRSGAGRVTLGVPECCIGFYQSRAFEVMCKPLASMDGHFALEFEDIDAFLKDKDSVVIGPGLSRSPDMGELVRHVIQTGTVPLVIDADGLYWLHEADFGLMRGKQVILTPHTGELARLCGCSIGDIEREPLTCGRKIADKIENILVHKSAYTVIHAKNATYLGAWGCPGMATAGSGDVLSGIIGALAAVLPLEEAAWAGAALHGAAGKLAAAEKSETAMIASDIIDCLPRIFCQIGR